MLMRLFRRPTPFAQEDVRRREPFAPDKEPREDAQADRLARERFEFKKRQAVEAGSMGYIWRTSHGCRYPQHRKLDGRFVPWNNPPAVDDGTAHAGELPGCACETEIIQ